MCALGGIEQAYLYTASPKVVPAFGTCSHLIGLQPDEPDAVPLAHQCDHAPECDGWSIGLACHLHAEFVSQLQPKNANVCYG